MIDNPFKRPATTPADELVSGKDAEGRLVVTGETNAAIPKNVSQIVVELSRRETLTDAEISFINNLAELGSRSISHIIARGVMPDDTEFTDAASRYSRAAYRIFVESKEKDQIEEDLEVFGRDKQATIRVLDRYSSINPSIRDLDGSARSLVEDCANEVAIMLERTLEANPTIGPETDSYLQGNISHIARLMAVAEEKKK